MNYRIVDIVDTSQSALSLPISCRSAAAAFAMDRYGPNPRLQIQIAYDSARVVDSVASRHRAYLQSLGITMASEPASLLKSFEVRIQTIKDSEARCK